MFVKKLRKSITKLILPFIHTIFKLLKANTRAVNFLNEKKNIANYAYNIERNILKENVRAIDLVSRYGGEEFVVILINTSAENARPVGERIVETIAEYPFDYDGEKVQMTISAGMSEYPTQDKSLKGLIDYADQAMYNVKQKGGNDIILYEN